MEFYIKNANMCREIQATWLDFIGDEQDEEKLVELAEKYMDLLYSCITTDRGDIIRNSK